MNDNPQASSRDPEIVQAQLGQIQAQLANIETYLAQFSALAERVERIEENFMLVADLYRYAKLRDTLAAGNWFAADKETINLILDIAGESDLEELSPHDIRNFPCNGLRVIDKLWRKYSRDRFGFSIQLQFYVELGGTLETTIEQNRELIERWGDRLGWREAGVWRQCDQLDYSLNAPVGCHPALWWNSPYGSKMTNYFLSRLLTCDLM